ncbi:21530_t:CDS:2 [Racocetra persica]|uniref:21530_t:CDS:1 n=1 Tax=Racocetra persica TaxID=160502 RepID=A0ACA9LA17_9GLOM|nr:21530_t:CDS:2 [Racocetra persica]
MPVVSVRIKAENNVKVNWIGVPVPEDITVRQFYEDLIAGKIVHEVQLNNEDRLQPVKVEFSSNTTGPFNVVSMECNMVEAIEAWGNRVQYYQTNSQVSLYSEASINIFSQMMNDTTSLTHLPTFAISDRSNALEKLRYDIVEWIRENNGGWSRDTAITTGKEFVKDLAAALWYIDKCDSEKLKSRSCNVPAEMEQFIGRFDIVRLKKKRERFDTTTLAYHSNILFKYTRSAWIRKSVFCWLINPLEILATNLSRYQEILQKQLIVTTQNHHSFEPVKKNNSFLTILQPNLTRQPHIIDRYQTLVTFFEQNNFWEPINIKSFLPNEPMPKHRYIKELDKGLPFKLAQYIHDSQHGSSVIYLWRIPSTISDSLCANFGNLNVKLY